jgi:hypothetical protein
LAADRSFRRDTVGDVAGARHRPYVDGSRGRRFGGLAAVACRSWAWAQAVNENLHEGREDRLLAWHAAHPEGGFDHFADCSPGMRLEIPGNVLWGPSGDDGLAVAYERTGGMHGGYNQACLAIFRLVAEHGNLEGAEASEAHRLGITPGRASGDVRLITASLYRAGLLRSARSDGPGQRGSAAEPAGKDGDD